jgi:hypothetical protein
MGFNSAFKGLNFEKKCLAEVWKRKAYQIHICCKQIARYYFVIFGLLHAVWCIKKTIVLTSV